VSTPLSPTAQQAPDPGLPSEIVTFGPNNVIDEQNLPPIYLEAYAEGDKLGTVRRFRLDQSQLQASQAFIAAVAVGVQTYFASLRGYSASDNSLSYRCTGEFISAGTTSAPVATVTGISLAGPSSVTKGTSASYIITTTYSDNTSTTSLSGLTLTTTVGSFSNGTLTVPLDAASDNLTIGASKGSISSTPKVISLTAPATTTPPPTTTARRAVTFETSDNIVATSNTLVFTNATGSGVALAGSGVNFPAGTEVDLMYEVPSLGAGAMGIGSTRGSQADGASNVLFIWQNDVNGRIIAKSNGVYFVSAAGVPSGPNTRLRLFGTGTVRAQYSTDAGLTWTGLYSDTGAEGLLNVSSTQWVKYFNASGTSTTQNITVGAAAVFAPPL
jgi:hypothetical protein